MTKKTFIFSNVLTSVDQGILKQVLNDEKNAYRLAQLDKPQSVEWEAAGSKPGKTNSHPNTHESLTLRPHVPREHRDSQLRVQTEPRFALD